MAAHDLLSEDAFSQRIAASQFYQRERRNSLAPDLYRRTSSQKPSNDEFLSDRVIRRRSRGSTKSAMTSKSSRRSSLPSQASRSRLNTSDVIQTKNVHSKSKTLDSDSSLRSLQTPFRLESGRTTGELGHSPLTTSKMEAEVHRSSSPRSSFPAFERHISTRHRATPSGPLDTFFEQKDDPATFPGDLQWIEEEQTRLQIARIDGLRQRTKLREKRKELQTKRATKCSADDAFMKYVRKGRSDTLQLGSPLSDPSTDAILDTLYEAMQTARDEYGETEFAYNQLEDVVDQIDFDVAKIEGRLIDPGASDHPVPISTAGISLTSAPESLLGISSETPEEYHQFHINYLDRLGDLDLAKEKYQNMTLERDSLLLQQRRRASLGVELHPDEFEFLAAFAALEAALLGEMNEIEVDIERWREKCLAEGIDIDEESTETQRETQVDTDDPSTGDLLEGFESAQTSKFDPSMFPELLPESDESKFKLRFLITDFDEGNKSDRINRWIQYQLQTSLIEVELLARVFLHFLRIFDFSQWDMDLSEWEVKVLLWWQKDEANKSPEEFRIAYTNSSADHSFESLYPRGRFVPTFSAVGTGTDHQEFISHRRTRSEPVWHRVGIVDTALSPSQEMPRSKEVT